MFNPQPKRIKRSKFGKQTKICSQCGNSFERHYTLSNFQWSVRKYCNRQCAGIVKRVNDGMNKDERCRRKNGSLKQGTPEYSEKISRTTKRAMYRTDVQEKIRKPKGAMSENNKIIRSNALVGKFPKNISSGNGMYGNVQRGTYICSKGDVYFRSKWEANYALYLDFLIQQNQILNWEFEAERFFFEKIKLGTRTYTPDFKVFNENGTIEYHEVKGHMDARSKTKLSRMKKYYPEVKVVLVERKTYADILKKLKEVIKFY